MLQSVGVPLRISNASVFQISTAKHDAPVTGTPFDMPAGWGDSESQAFVEGLRLLQVADGNNWMIKAGDTNAHVCSYLRWAGVADDFKSGCIGRFGEKAPSGSPVLWSNFSENDIHALWG